MREPTTSSGIRLRQVLSGALLLLLAAAILVGSGVLAYESLRVL